MRVRLDDAEWNVDDELVNQSKESLLGAAKKLAAEKGAIISGITVDGIEMEEDIFLQLSAGVDVQFKTQSIRELLRESLADGQDYFPSLLSGLERVADLFEANNKEEGLRLFAQALEGIGWILQVMDRASLLLCTRTDLLSSGDFSREFADLCEKVTALSVVLEEGKHLEIAYRIREDLLPSLRKLSLCWGEMVSQAEGTLQ